MTANLIDLRHTREAAPDTPPDLQTYLAQLVGEPFRFARVSYGDELTLHFGDLKPARSPKLKNRFYGAYILGVRASMWILKSGTVPLARIYGFDSGESLGETGKPIGKEDKGKPMSKEQKKDIEAEPLIQSGSRVKLASPFVVKPENRFGLQLGFSDGSTIHIMPAPLGADAPEEAEDYALPELADWEVISPNGLLSAGPGLIWAFKPSVRIGSLPTPSRANAESDGASDGGA